MTPLDLLLTSLAFLAGALGLWLAACFVVVAVALFKPRGKKRPGESVADALERLDASRAVDDYDARSALGVRRVKVIGDVEQGVPDRVELDAKGVTQADRSFLRGGDLVADGGDVLADSHDLIVGEARS
ncbi:hypothetical protein ACIPY5_12265 [Microbacterium sp. NPDC089698]|uniref:hypothetical protein n=1 Tax=Microbacterium sp. NPDC089698 TaxID=3364200 RepID=UPI003808AF39